MRCSLNQPYLAFEPPLGFGTNRIAAHHTTLAKNTLLGQISHHQERRLSHLTASTSSSSRQGTVTAPLATFLNNASRYTSRWTLAASAASPGTEASPSAHLTRSQKTYDLVALSNLCVDIVVQTSELPPEDESSRQELLTNLTANPPGVSSWEVGGNTNTLIAASRLGLRVASIGHIGNDIYGKFLSNVLKHEGIKLIEPVAANVDFSSLKTCTTNGLTKEHETTLLCFVLVAPNSEHSFCSRYDFGPWPLLSFVDTLSPGVERVLDSTAALFVNGFVFDEVPSHIVTAAAQRAQQGGAAVFFDPGPRSWTFNDNGARKAALNAILDLSDVVLMTEEEAEAVTGCGNAEAAARFILDRPGARTEWCIVKRGAEGAILVSRSPRAAVYEQRALKVDVRDTVGCGDSFAAAVILGYTRQHSIPAVMALASAVGAATAMGSGAGRNVAKAEAVAALLEKAVSDCEDGRHSVALGLLQESLSTSQDEE